MRRPLAPLLAAAILTLTNGAEAANPAGAHHARGAVGMFWFMHISDLHIGANLIEGPHAKEHAAFALGEAVTVIKPSFVWATGDLQDGSGKVGVGGTGIPTSGQSQTQWDWYKEIYTAAGMKPDFYFDLLGNHDVYGDQGATYYLANSLWGSTQHKTWMDFTVKTVLGEYHFFGIDSTNDYFRPLSNCCPGFIDDQITQLDTSMQQHKDARLTFVAAHHALDGNGNEPTANADKVRALLQRDKAFYLHGDVHEYKEYLDTTGMVVNEVGSLGKGDSQNIAVGVVDHDAFVYRATDVTDPWPFVILTAPVSRDLRDVGVNPWAYTVCKDRKDNAFRAITFSYAAPTKVTLQIGSLAPIAMAPVNGTFDFKLPVWEAFADTRALATGPLQVTVTAEAGGKSRSDVVTVELADGPCAPLPDDVPVEPDAGPGDTGAPPDDGGSDTGAATADGGGDAGADTGQAVDVAADAGCGCRVVGPERDRRGGAAASASIALAALGLGAVLARRRR